MPPHPTESALRLAFDAAPDAMFVCALPSLEVKHANAVGERLLGGERSLAGRLDPAPDWLEDPVPRLGFLTRPGADPLTVEMIATRVPDADPPLGLLRLLRSEEAELYLLLLNSTEDFVGLVDHQGGRLYTNPAFFRATGFSPEEVAATDFRTRIHPDDLALVERTRQANLRGERSRIEYRCKCKDGRYLWLDLRAAPIIGQDGKVERIVWASRDVSDRKSVELELRDSRKFIERVADALPQMLFVYDLAENRHVYVNARSEEIRGYTAGEMLRMAPGEAVSHIHPDDRLPLQEVGRLMESMSEAQVFDSRYRVLHKKHGYRMVRTRSLVFRHDAAGRPWQVLGVSELVEEPQVGA